MNRRGFTLIELLAVIVVLGLVLVVTVPSVIGNINNNKLSSLHTLSKEVAKWYDRKIVEDKLSTDTEKILTNINNNEWYCINNVNGVNIAKIYGLSEKDILLNNMSGNANVVNNGFDEEGRTDVSPRNNDSCSAIRIIDGHAEVFLIAAQDGKFDTNGEDWTYAVSSGKNGFDTIGSDD